MRALNPFTASAFFDKITVPVVFMEWEFLRKESKDSAVRRRQVDDWLEFFYRRCYVVYQEDGQQKLDRNWNAWSYDVIFKLEPMKDGSKCAQTV